ncbi:Uncharacterised protein [uncultured archaeon]|nr:Uncharacterised protein [uncultured archaeon]
MTGWGVAPNSVLLAPSRPQTFLANSITASCMPKHNPRYGTFISRAYCTALIFPSVPREPKPPGTRIPSTSRSIRSGEPCSRSSASIQMTSIFTPASIPACFRLSRMDR